MVARSSSFIRNVATVGVSRTAPSGKVESRSPVHRTNDSTWLLLPIRAWRFLFYWRGAFARHEGARRFSGAGLSKIKC